ncbi:uncharacterized protein BX663DRAFT_577632, partial [Cokeromyces recurvatus]|uniref:uncharacterized protein n=1 Tax=Cokeromyces recurvatus TaxID=90255 RepID=UPI00221EEFD9
EFLTKSSLTSEVISIHYTQITTSHRTSHPIHCKMKLFHYYIKKQKEEQHIFEDNAVFVTDTWAAPNARYHEPTKGIGFWDPLKKHNLLVYLINECRTNNCCPECHSMSL